MRVTAEHKQATRQALIAAVADIIEADGYEAATVTAIAQKAGVTTGAIYSQFGDRRRLVLAGVEELRSRWVPEFPSHHPLPEALASWVPRYLAIGRSSHGYSLMVAQQAIGAEILADPLMRHEDALLVQRLLADLARGLESSAALSGRGLALPGADAAAVFLAMVRGAVNLVITNPDAVHPEALVESIMRMLLLPEEPAR